MAEQQIVDRGGDCDLDVAERSWPHRVTRLAHKHGHFFAYLNYSRIYFDHTFSLNHQKVRTPSSVRMTLRRAGPEVTFPHLPKVIAR